MTSDSLTKKIYWIVFYTAQLFMFRILFYGSDICISCHCDLHSIYSSELKAALCTLPALLLLPTALIFSNMQMLVHEWHVLLFFDRCQHKGSSSLQKAAVFLQQIFSFLLIITIAISAHDAVASVVLLATISQSNRLLLQKI